MYDHPFLKFSIKSITQTHLTQPYNSQVSLQPSRRKYPPLIPLANSASIAGTALPPHIKKGKYIPSRIEAAADANSAITVHNAKLKARKPDTRRALYRCACARLAHCFQPGARSGAAFNKDR